MRKLLLSTSFLLMGFSFVQAQTVDEVISKHITAMGGLERLKAVQTVRLTLRVDAGDPKRNFKSVLMRKRGGKGDKFRMEDTIRLPWPASPIPAASASEITTIEGCDGQTQWFKNGDTPTTTDPWPCEDFADLDSPLMTYKQKGLSVVLAGREKIEGKELYHLKLNGKDLRTTQFYVDAKSFLLDRTVSESHGRYQEHIYSDYRKVDGIMVAFCDEMRLWMVQDDPEREEKLSSLRLPGDAGRQKFIVEKAEVNIPLDDSLFVMPSAAKTPADHPNPANKK